MPDYASILRRSISALPDPAPETREAVYQRARAALARQLTAVEPPLSTREIEAQHQELEDAIAQLEADFAPEEPSAPEPDYGPDQSAGRDTFFDSAESDANFAGPDAVTMPMGTERRPTGTRTETTAAENRSETRGYDSYDQDDDDDYEDAADARSGRLPLLLGSLFLLVILVGVAAYAYTERGRIAGLLGRGGERQTAAITTPPAPEPASPAPAQPAAEAGDAGGVQKDPDRLTNGPDAATPDAAGAPVPEPAVPAAATPEAAPPPTPADTAAESSTDQAVPEAPPSPPPADSAPAAPLPAESPVGLQNQQTTAQGDESIVAQKAIFYFQGAQGSPGKASEGSVTWAQTSRDNAPAIQATLRLSEQNATVRITIYKNSDASLPASHLVEVQFTGSLGPSPIQRVPALVMKQTEQARGQPLTGAAVPVTSDLFWIALSNDPGQAKHNLDLLHEGSWFDLPILFNDQTRALLTFEKGVPGDKVFETVLAGWTPPPG